MAKIILSVVAALFLTGTVVARKPADTGATYSVKKRAIRAPRSKPDVPVPQHGFPPSLPWYNKIWGAGGPGPAGVGSGMEKK
jgi:hypothetical protein